jgi:hypothetical protein
VIRHTLSFRLVHPPGSAAEQEFLDAALVLAAIPGVQRFERLRQTSTRNDFSLGLSMEFADRAAYDAYVAHPVHRAFVAQRWAAEVDDFLELDYQPLG